MRESRNITAGVGLLGNSGLCFTVNNWHDLVALFVMSFSALQIIWAAMNSFDTIYLSLFNDFQRRKCSENEHEISIVWLVC